MTLSAPGDGFLTRWSIHLTLFFFMLGMMLQQFVGQNMVLYKICMEHHGDGVCRDMSSHQEVQDAVQAESSSYLTLQMICLGLPSAFSTLVLGAASDRYGRRKIMMITSLGVTLLCFSSFYQSTFAGMSKLVIILGGLATGVTGGVLSFIGTVTNYITDVTPEKERTATLNTVFPFMGLGAMVGTLSAGALESFFGTKVVLGLSFGFEGVALALLTFFVKDVLPLQTEGTGKSKTLLSEMAAGAKCLFQDNPKGNRRRLLTLLLNGIIMMAYVMSEGGIMMLYTKRQPFNWTSSTYGFYAAGKQVAGVLGQVFGSGMVMKMAGATGSVRADFTILQIGALVGIIGNLICALSPNSFMLLLAIPFCFLAGPAQSAGGSITSKLVAADKKGSYSAFTSFLTTLAAPVLSSGYNHMYASSVTSGKPGAIFVAYAFLKVIGLLVLSFGKLGLENDSKNTESAKSS